MIKADWEATARAQAEEIGRLNAEVESLRRQVAELKTLGASVDEATKHLQGELDECRAEPKWDPTSAAVFTRLLHEEDEHNAVVATMLQQETALQRSLAESRAEVERLRGLCGEAADHIDGLYRDVGYSHRSMRDMASRLRTAAKGEGA